MSTTGCISLKVLGDGLDFDSISQNLKLTPTNTYKKGIVYNKIAGETENDCWYYDLDIEEGETANEVMQKILFELNQKNDYIKDLSQRAYVVLRCAIQSELAQIYFELSPDTLKEIVELSIGIEFSIFSWGEVENRE